MAILNKRISSATLPELQKDARLGSIIRDVASAPAVTNEMYRTINPSASTNQTSSPAYVSQLTSALREMQPQNYTSMVAPTRSNNVSLMSSQMPDMSGVPNISKGPITSITQPGDTARQKIGSTTSTSGGIPSAVVNALAGAVMGLGAQKITTGGNKSGSQTGSQSGNKSGSQNPPVTSTTDKLPTWAQGNPTIKSNGDGTYTQKNDDGSTTTLDKNGNIIGTTDSNGDIVDKNGSTVHDNGDGTHTITARDGTVTVLNDEGIDVTGHQAGPEVFPPAVDDTQYSNVGNPHSEYGDEFKRGGLAVMMKDGGVPHYAGGGVTQDNGNGTFTTKNADGSTVTKDDQGNIIRQTDASGNILSGDTSINPVQSILDLLGTSGGAAGAGGILAALLSSTGGNTNNVNTGLDMSTYGLLNPRTTNFGMGPARYVPHSDYSQRGSYTPNAELLHNLNAPASNPVNEGDYKDPYITNRPGTNNGMTGGTDINAIIAQIVNAMKNKQLASQVNQASSTANASAVKTPAPSSVANTSNTSTTPPQFVVGGGGEGGYQGYPSKEAYDRAVAYNKAQQDAAQAKLDAFHIDPSSPFYKYVKDPSLIPHFYNESDADALKRVKQNAMEYAEQLAGRAAQSSTFAGSQFVVGNGGITDANGKFIEPGPDETSSVVSDANGVPRYVKKSEAAAQEKAKQDYLKAHGNIIDTEHPWNVLSEDTTTHTAQDALAKLNQTTGTPAERQAALNQFLKTTTFTPEQLAAASNGIWSVNDLKSQMAGNPVLGQPDVYRPTDPTKGSTSTLEDMAKARAKISSLGMNVSDMGGGMGDITPTKSNFTPTAPTAGGLNALAGQVSTPMTGVIDGGIKKTGTNDFDPNSGYQNPGSSIAQMQNDLYPSKQPTPYGGNGGIYGPGGMFPSSAPEQTIGDLGPQDYFVDPERGGPAAPSAPTPNEPTPYVRSGPTPDEIQAMIDAQNAYSSSGGAKKGGAIHKATGGLTHYTYGKPADVLENLGLRGQQMAQGGLPHVSNVPIVEGRMDFRQGSAVHGEGDGQSDDIPAMLADGEYVIDADTVAQIGNGSTKAGAQALDKFRESIRAHKRSAPINKIPPKTKALTSYLKVK